MLVVRARDVDVEGILFIIVEVLVTPGDIVVPGQVDEVEEAFLGLSDLPVSRSLFSQLSTLLWSALCMSC